MRSLVTVCYCDAQCSTETETCDKSLMKRHTAVAGTPVGLKGVRWTDANDKHVETYAGLFRIKVGDAVASYGVLL